MKKIKYLIIALVLFVPQIVMASPNATITTNASTIEKGKSVTATVTLTDTAAWNVKIAGSGAATCSTKQADVTSDGKSATKKFTLSCTSTSEGKITFNVIGDITSGAGQTKDISLTKQVTVTKPKSSDNNLSDLKVNGTTVSGFSNSKTSYTLKDTSGTSISVSATASDSKASISGTGSKTLQYGKNVFSIVVTAENGSKKTYTVTVNKPDPRSTNNNLKSLVVDKETIAFDKNTTSYTIKLEHNVNEITITAQAEDAKASVSGTGIKTLNDYINEFKIIVKAENGSTKTYIIKAIRKDLQGNYGKLSTDNSVKSINITGYDFKFDKDVRKYNILVDENVNEVEFNVVPNDSTATVSIQNNNNLKEGLNEVIVQITAENGSINEYLFNVYKISKGAAANNDNIENEQKDGSCLEWKIALIVEFVLLIIMLIIVILTLKKKKKEIKNILKIYD